jgi:hypothetical protein
MHSPPSPSCPRSNARSSLGNVWPLVCEPTPHCLLRSGKPPIALASMRLEWRKRPAKQVRLLVWLTARRHTTLRRRSAKLRTTWRSAVELRSARLPSMSSASYASAMQVGRTNAALRYATAGNLRRLGLMSPPGVLRARQPHELLGQVRRDRSSRIKVCERVRRRLIVDPVDLPARCSPDVIRVTEVLGHGPQLRAAMRREIGNLFLEMFRRGRASSTRCEQLLDVTRLVAHHQGGQIFSRRR